MEDDFKMVIRGFHSSPEDMKKILERRDPLKPLSSEEKEVAGKLGISEDDYARSCAAGVIGNMRLLDKGTLLGEHVKSLLSEIGPNCQLEQVEWIPFDEEMEGWKLRIQTPGNILNVRVPRDLVDDISDERTVDLVEELKEAAIAGNSLHLKEQNNSLSHCQLIQPKSTKAMTSGRYGFLAALC